VLLLRYKWFDSPQSCEEYAKVRSSRNIREQEMMHLTLNQLGRFEALDDLSGKPLTFPRKKAAALLAYLATPTGHERSREELADFFWGHTGEAGARNNLRQTLHSIHRMLPDFRGLETTLHSILLLPEHVTTDVSEFELAAKEATLSALERAAELYVGHFLQGFSLREDSFERWRAGQNARLRDIGLSVFERLMSKYLALGRSAEAAQTANRCLAIDRLHEVAHQTLIQVYAAQGRKGLARKQYEQYRDLLASELGVKPSSLTKSVYASVSGSQSKALPPHDDAIDAPTIIPEIQNAPIVVILPFEYKGEHSHTKSQTVTGSLNRNLIAVLSKFLPITIVDYHSVSVVMAGNTSTFDFANMFGARYTIEGSVWSLGGRWRVDFSLIDVITGRHIYNGTNQYTDVDLFQVTDNIALKIATKAAIQIETAERIRAVIGNEKSLDAWGSFCRGMALLDLFSVKQIIPAQNAFINAIEIEPNNAWAIAGLARSVLQEGICLIGRTREETYAMSLDLAKQAYFLDRNDPFVNWTLGKSYQRVERLDLAGDALQHALNVIPENPEICAEMGNLLAYLGTPEKGIPMIEYGVQYSETSLSILARSHLQTGNYEKARDWANHTIQIQPDNSWAYFILGSALGQLDCPSEAIAALAECERVHPGRVEAEFLIQPTQYKNPSEQDHILNGVLKAGWQP
jgi:DNA-binding SARP family transcriptional activator/TolB-like protein